MDPSNPILKAYNRQHDVIVTVATREHRTHRPTPDRKEEPSLDPTATRESRSRSTVPPIRSFASRRVETSRTLLPQSTSVTARSKNPQDIHLLRLGSPTTDKSTFPFRAMSLGKSRRSALESILDLDWQQTAEMQMQLRTNQFQLTHQRIITAVRPPTYRECPRLGHQAENTE